MTNRKLVPEVLKRSLVWSATVVVLQTPEDESAGHDAQLQRAVEDLLERLPDTAGVQQP